MSKQNFNYVYSYNFDFLNKDEKINRNDDVIALSKKIYDYYIKTLEKNDNRIFAKYDIYKSTKEHNFIYEAVYFYNHFKSFFKSKTKIRFKKDLVSCFVIELKDYYEKSYYVYFCVDKKEYEERKDLYLNEVFNFFKSEIDKKAEEKKGVINE